MSLIDPTARRIATAVLVVAGSWTAAPAQNPDDRPDVDRVRPVSFTQDIQPLVSGFCATCHHGDDPQGGFVLDTYEQVRQQAEHGELLVRINDRRDPMPQSGLMPKAARDLFQRWTDGGYRRDGPPRSNPRGKNAMQFTPPAITPVDIHEEGFEFLERMQGHWVGRLNLMGQEFDWFAFDYRAIAPSHVHGIFEGGTMGNLFTSFFLTEFQDTRTIMARNGGILNGIYRTSYFVLDQVNRKGPATYYRFVDAYGGADIMWIDVTFKGSRIDLRSYTSRMGLISPPALHMNFQGVRKRPELARAAAESVGFPDDVVDFDFSRGLPRPNWGDEDPLTSASYIWEQPGQSLEQLGRLAGDPYRIDQMPHVSRLTVKVRRSQDTEGRRLLFLLSQKALTNAKGRFITEYGFVKLDLLDSILQFPEISAAVDEFTFTYLHPGDYYLTVVADLNGDGYPSPGDITHPRRLVHVEPESTKAVVIGDLAVQN